jgi:hypothetical protein
LEALKRVFLDQHPSIAGIGKRIEKIVSKQQVESIGEFLFGVAAANGEIDKAEITALRSAFRTLGIDSKSLDRQLAEYRRIGKEPVEIIPGPENVEAGEVIPTQEPEPVHHAYKLDRSLIDILMRETAQVQSILAEAMGDEQVEVSAESVPELPPEPARADPRFEGIDKRYAPILAILCGRTTWDRSEFDDLIRRHSLMTSGTIDKINEWAYERFDDPILEEDGNAIRVHSHLVAESS